MIVLNSLHWKLPCPVDSQGSSKLLDDISMRRHVFCRKKIENKSESTLDYPLKSIGIFFAWLDALKKAIPAQNDSIETLSSKLKPQKTRVRFKLRTDSLEVSLFHSRSQEFLQSFLQYILPFPVGILAGMNNRCQSCFCANLDRVITFLRLILENKKPM